MEILAKTRIFKNQIMGDDQSGKGILNFEVISNLVMNAKKKENKDLEFIFIQLVTHNEKFGDWILDKLLC